uniref:Uncharacterized protein n=1 Tax=Tanacetum cinerariifolium TaxID=118510 RepID=A0A699HZU2_TANCI|nr:hypothetical protein [Tanacetum cinerariifolium]
MPKSIHLDHHDTAHYIAMYHRTGGFIEHEREVYKSLVSRLFYKGRVIEPTYLDDQPNLFPTFAAIGVPCQGVCVYTPNWPISSLHYIVDPHTDIYPPPHEDPSLIRDALFYKRTQAKTQKMKGVDTILDPFQMIVSELKTEFKKWEVILSENVVSLTRNKDHPNAYICCSTASLLKTLSTLLIDIC